MLRGLNRVRTRLALLLGAHDGNAAIEFSIAAPVLAIIFVPMIDIGMMVYQQMQVQGAAQAGAQYAMAHGWNSSRIRNAVTSATPLSVSTWPAPSKSCKTFRNIVTHTKRLGREIETLTMIGAKALHGTEITNTSELGAWAVAHQDVTL